MCVYLSPLSLLSSLVVHPGESRAIALPTIKHHSDVAVHEYTQEIPPKRLKLQEEPGKTLLVEGKCYFVKFKGTIVGLSSSFQTVRLI